MTSNYGISLNFETKRDLYNVCDFSDPKKAKVIVRGVSYRRAISEFETLAGYPYSQHRSKYVGDYSPEPRGG